MSGVFRERSTNYQRCMAPIKDRLRALERLEQFLRGAEGLRCINPGIFTAHPQDVETLQEDSKHLVNSENSLQAEDFNTNTDFHQTNFNQSNTQEGLSLLDHAQNYHTFINQQNREKKLQEKWDEVLPSLLGAYLLLKLSFLDGGLALPENLLQLPPVEMQSL
ncbi:hypothetical protein PCASD_25933 [Puccinia coronata f. sp. avenae]|uniref:Uncharacterized protein n=1 Tax=Puccinia coronata f. sp. avenae TaxID=200324 RepID=A0A2N5TQX2_9BASI|nr:hypothetical protein PCASD_25933 [Puccinia coronata f. sp. avenae]